MRGATDRRRHLVSRLFTVLCALAAASGIVALGVLVADVARDGLGGVDVEFLSSFASRFPEKAGIRAGLAGSFWLIILTACFAFPIALAAAIYLEEYAPRHWFTRLIQLNLANLAGVPSIVYGILGLVLFVRTLGLGRSLLAGALTLAALILPVLIIAAQEAIRGVPASLRDGAYALGATRWQVVRYQVLPMALPGVLTGTILALARALGETAPLIAVGGVGFIAFTPSSVTDPFTALPLQIFNWVSRPQDEFRALAASGIIVLLALMLLLNGAAVVLRTRLRRSG